MACSADSKLFHYYSGWGVAGGNENKANSANQLEMKLGLGNKIWQRKSMKLCLKMFSCQFYGNLLLSRLLQLPEWWYGAEWWSFFLWCSQTWIENDFFQNFKTQVCCLSQRKQIEFWVLIYWVIHETSNDHFIVKYDNYKT